MNKLTKCKTCKMDIAKGVKACPNCGKDNRSFFAKHKIITTVGIVFIVVAIANAGKTPNTTVVEHTSSNISSNQTATPSQSTTNTQTTAPKVVEKVEEKPKVSVEFTNALKNADNYNKLMHMSKRGIYDQLTSQYGGKFSAEAAQYAVDNLRADYEKNAWETAKTFQKSMSMSKQSIYDQLISEFGSKFTKEEAQYAIDNLQE